MRCYKIWLGFVKNRTVTRDIIVEYLSTNKNRRNNLALLRILYPEYTKDFKFPKRSFKPKILPNKEQLKIFYDALPDKYKPIFILLGESGLRISELLGSSIDKDNKMLIPKGHNGQTKHSWVSFYQTPIDSIPQFNRDSITHAFLKTSKKTGIIIYPHLLRSIFAREMSKAGVQDRFIDCFCGRTPQSVLARSYSDFSPEALKEIYDKANISIF